MSHLSTTASETDAFESDDALRRVYGDDATFSRVGPFTLVHLDAPSPELVARRMAEFDPREFFVDDCPLCQAARSDGGHVVFDGRPFDDADVDAETALVTPVWSATPLKAPAAELLKAFERLDVAADVLICSLEPVAGADLLKRAIEDVGFLHDRFIETLWADETLDRLQAFERQLARALTTLELVHGAHPTLDADVQAVEGALESVAGIWRNL